MRPPDTCTAPPASGPATLLGGALLAVALVALLPGCPGDAAGTTTDGGPSQGIGSDAAGSGAGDLGPGAGADDPPDTTQLSPIGGGGDNPGGGGDNPGGGGDSPGGGDATGGGALGGFGADCTDGSQCTSGFCVPGPNGPFCSVPCTDACEPGYECQEIADSGGDKTFICVDVTATLCHPCTLDDECNQGATVKANRCLSHGGEGSFCGLACGSSGSSGCPSGFVCEERPAPEGAAPNGDLHQCVPAEGALCECNELAQKLGLKTRCALSNGEGACGGWRACSPEGLSACGAPTPAPETCNGIDDDCDGVTDEDFQDAPSMTPTCEVTNEHGSCEGAWKCAAGQLSCEGPSAAAELCNGADEDCDGLIDEVFPDTDGDDVADCMDGDDDGDGWADGEDCKPLDAAIHPDAVEVCNGVDDDCDGEVDGNDATNCTPYYRDVDKDGFGDDNKPPLCLCAPDPVAYYTAIEAGDCNDLTNLISPAATEKCNALDDDCDGAIDEDQGEDSDGDGLVNCVDDDDDNDGSVDPVDCAPLNPAIYPGAPELCNDVDDNCNGVDDEEGALGCIDHWRDLDNDEQGAANVPPKCLCAPDEASLFTADNADDCDDLSAQVYLGAPEDCNGVDDDCDGETDENAVLDTDGDGMPDCFDTDDDNDGFLDPVDCRPKDNQAYPGAVEVCNGKDDDCDGLTDPQDTPGCQPFYLDADKDGFGASSGVSQCHCGPDPSGFYIADNTDDCNDALATANPLGIEVCNFQDDDCDGVVDDGVSSPCGNCSPTCVLEVGTSDQPYQPNPDNSSGITPTEDGGITLSSNTFEFPFIWIANSAEATVSKLNTDTGCEVAKYAVCGNPSRTAVDLEGNGIVACRNDGGVAKIAVLLPDCLDKNGNGVIETSADADGDCTISAAEMVPNDECIIWTSFPDGYSPTGCPSSGAGCARAAGVDAENHVWVGMWNSAHLIRLEPQSGALVIQHPLTVRPYGLAIDQAGSIWVASRAPNGLARVDPVTGQDGYWGHPSGYVYGLAIDPLGKIWVAGGEARTVARFDPDTETWMTFGPLDSGNSRGVAVRIEEDAAGNVTAADVLVGHHTWSGCGADGTHRHVSVIDALTLTQKPSLDIGFDGGPVGVAVDSLGFVWSVNQCTSSATKIDPKTGAVLGSWGVGLSPYTYSDMTGYALKTITTSQGFYRQIFSGWQGTVTLWDQLLIQADLPGDGLTWLEVSYRTADTIVGLSAAPWVGPIGPFPPAKFPLELGLIANHVEIRLTLGTSDPNLVPTVHAISLIAFEQDP